VLILLAGLYLGPKIPSVAGAGSVYISPGVITQQSVGSNFTIQVKVAGFDQFNGWEVQVAYDQNVINATKISTSGNIFVANTTGGIAFEVRNCVNGGGTGCCSTTSCSPLDGPGVADSAYGYTKPVNGNGLLFNVTFRVVGSGPYSPITIQNDVFSNGGSSGVVHTSTFGSYGCLCPDFKLTPNRSSLILGPGSSAGSNITLTAVYNFSGLVKLTATPSDKGITAALFPNQTVLPVNGTAVISLLVQALANASKTSYTITVFANSTKLPPHSLPHYLYMSVLVQAEPGFSLFASPSQLLTHQASSNSTTIIVTSENYFTGTVNLTVSGPTPATLDKTSLFIPAAGSANATLTITTQSSVFPFEDDFFVNATSGGLRHTEEVIAQPPPGDFSISANPATATVEQGNTEVASVGVTSQDYFIGTVYVLGTTKSGLGFSFDPGTLFLNYSQTVFFKLKLTTDTSTTLGNHTIDLTVYGQLIGKAGVGLAPREHTLAFTLIVAAIPQTASRTFLGLQEPVFYSVIGGLAIALAVLGFFEARRAKRPKVRPILEN
jgi:hypothetical protein